MPAVSAAGSRGWIGPTKRVSDVLASAGADREPDGSFRLDGVRIVGYGDEETIITESVGFFVQGQRLPLLPRLQNGGGCCLLVF